MRYLPAPSSCAPALLAIFVAACGTRESAAPPAPPSVPCDVAAVMAKNCTICHAATPVYGAPMALMTAADFAAPAVTDPNKKVYELVGARVHDDAKPMPQAPYPRLSGSELSTIDAWIASGAPATTTAACSDGGPSNDAAADAATDGAVKGCNSDTHLAPTSPWAMPENDADDYICYEYNVPAASKHAVQLAARVDNAKIVHHLLLFKATSSTGYSGTPVKCTSAFGNPGWSLVYGWAPGVSSLSLPPEASLTLDKSAHYVVQVHYNNLGHLKGQTDSSGFDLCTEPSPRANEADIIALGSVNFPQIPAHGTLDYTCDYKAGAQLDGTHLIATWGHMHTIGQSISLIQAPAGGGAATTLIDEPKFSFDSQKWVPKSGVLASSDNLRTRCVWNNTTSNPVKFGENTGDEMCFSFIMYYPKKNFLAWAQPATASVCGITK